MFKYLCCALLLVNCTENVDDQLSPIQIFEDEIRTLKEYFQIPGLAVLIDKKGETLYEKYLGFADTEKNVVVDSLTVFPIASLTKIMSSVVVFEQIEAGNLNLDQPVNTILEEPDVPDSILVKHLLSHTSQGTVGKHFYYSGRYGLMTPILEEVSGQSFIQLMETKIFAPLRLEHSFLLEDSAQFFSTAENVALPYYYDQTETGLIEYGYSSAAGVVSTVRDLAIFNRALDQNLLIKATSKKQMFAGISEDLPYAYGIFTTSLFGEKVYWGYGQYDCYSSLYFKVPDQDLTLLMTANNNLMSDPARLIYGDPASSLFVMSFMKNFVLDKQELPLLSDSINPDQVEENACEFYREKLLAEALAVSFLARFNPDEFDRSVSLLEKVFKQYPDYLNYGDLSLLHNLVFLKDVVVNHELGQFDQFDEHIEKIGNGLLKDDPLNPYLHYYLGNLYDQQGKMNLARNHFTQLTTTENFSQNWVTFEAQNWLKKHAED